MSNTSIWSHAFTHCPYAQLLPTNERRRLRDAAQIFLKTKSFDSAAGFKLTQEMCAVIAVKACVPILNLGLDYYSSWRDIVVYPGDFRVDNEYMDDIGIVHREIRDLCGESLAQGPMILSWQAIADECDEADQDLVIHECAHKLDILNGEANGYPPLHSSMSPDQWTAAFSEAFERFGTLVDDGIETALDPYAATDPAEFFAVLSETFFVCPIIVHKDFPDIYSQLIKFYRQDPYLTFRNAS